MRHSRVLFRKPCRRTGVARLQCSLRSILLTAVAAAFAVPVVGQDAYRSPSELKKLELEELVDVEITSASRRPEPLSQAASAIDVITADEISRNLNQAANGVVKISEESAAVAEPEMGSLP